MSASKLYSRYQLIQMGWSTGSVADLLVEHSRETIDHQTTVYYSVADAVRVMIETDSWISANYMAPSVNARGRRSLGSRKYWPKRVLLARPL